MLVWLALVGLVAGRIGWKLPRSALCMPFPARLRSGSAPFWVVLFEARKEDHVTGGWSAWIGSFTLTTGGPTGPIRARSEGLYFNRRVVQLKHFPRTERFFSRDGGPSGGLKNRA